MTVERGSETSRAFAEWLTAWSTVWSVALWTEQAQLLEVTRQQRGETRQLREEKRQLLVETRQLQGGTRQLQDSMNNYGRRARH
jgi:uncharacterized protein YlxW (UPF0749 family)